MLGSLEEGEAFRKDLGSLEEGETFRKDLGFQHASLAIGVQTRAHRRKKKNIQIAEIALS